jgi:hypothetical protein
MKKKITITLTLVALILLAAVPAMATHGGLQPGEQITLEQNVPVNLVFIGYDQGSIDEGALLGELPGTYTPLVRFPQFYGLPGRDVGLDFTFDYNIHFANAWFEDRFFNYLEQIGQPDVMTSFQSDYNDQVNNVLDVEGPVLYLDGPTVERWLSTRSRYLGIDTRTGYTVFFINWFDRDDFQFHLYTKTDEPDPDTNYNFGEIRDSRKMIAWGGSHSRTWFYDLSAGPEAWTDNWNVDDPDLNGNGFEEYRMPPIWEYTSGGYRDPAALSSDLGLVTRFVAIDLLFTPSPLYDPLVTAPGLNGDKVAHIEMFEDDPADSGLNWIDAGVIYDELSAFEPYYSWQVNLEDNDPIDAGAERAYRIFNGILIDNDCWNAFGTPFAQLFCYFDANLGTYVPAYGSTDYVANVFAFNSTDANHPGGLLGFADDNWVDGTQSYVFQFDIPFFRSLGYGFSATTIHEVGHHIGLSHPHDGYDAELGLDFGASDGLYFAWSGNEADSVMHYLAMSNSFGQFNQDTMYRVEAAGYLNWANALAAAILADPDADTVAPLVSYADRQAARAIQSFNRWNYLAAATHAYTAYQTLADAADQLGLSTSFQALDIYNLIPDDAYVPHEGDPIRFPNN